jgi:hypothetical protein
MSRSSGGAALKQDVDAVAVEELDTRPMEDVVVPISRRLTLVELSERTCKWPIGDPCLKVSTSAGMIPAMPRPIAATTPSWPSSLQASADAPADPLSSVKAKKR